MSHTVNSFVCVLRRIQDQAHIVALKQREILSVRIIIFKKPILEMSSSLLAPAYMAYQHQREKRFRVHTVLHFMEQPSTIYRNFPIDKSPRAAPVKNIYS